MLVRLTPEQCARQWNVIKQAVASALPPIALNEGTLQVVLEKLMSAEMQCWVSYREEKGRNVIDGVLTTCIWVDDYSDTKSLLIYSLLSSRSVTESWEEGTRALKKYASRHGCKQLIAFVNNPEILPLARRVGAEIIHFVSIPLEHGIT